MTSHNQDPPVSHEDVVRDPDPGGAPEPVNIAPDLPSTAPYVTIRVIEQAELAESDDPDAPMTLSVESDGVEPGVLALFYVTALPAAENPLTAAVANVVDQHGERYPEVVEILAGFADYVGFPMPESGK